MTAGDRGRVNLDDIVVATEDVFADSQRQPPAVLQKQTEARGLAQARRFGDEGRLSTKRIPEPVRGPDESRVARITAERVADLGDETAEIRFRDECRGPQKLVQLVLRQRAGSMFHQDSQKLECLRRQMDLAVRPDKLSGIGLEGEFAKPKFHSRTYRNPMNHPKSPKTAGASAFILAVQEVAMKDAWPEKHVPIRALRGVTCRVQP